jgi:hypothetical protein
MSDRRIQQLEEEVRWLRRQLANVPVRVVHGGGGGASKGITFYTTNNATNLRNLYGDVEEPALGYTTDYGIYYAKSGDNWISISHMVCHSTME